MNNKEEITKLESNTIQPIALDERHGTAKDLFTIWFGVNIMLLTIVTGALSVSVFKLRFDWALTALALGNLVGAIFMALHAAQGPQLGVPQMVQTRGQFGSIGSLLVVGIVIIMYVGFVSSNLVLTGEALTSLRPGLSENWGIALVGTLGLIAAIYGYDSIHAYARIMSYVSGAALVAAFFWIIGVHGLPGDFFTRGGFHLSGFLGTVSTGALWQIAYAPYVSDYSRYMPKDTGAKPAFWASYWGCTLGSLLPMILGTVIALAAPSSKMVAAFALLLGPLAMPVLLIFSVGIAAASAMNIYCGALSTLTFGQTLAPNWSPRHRARVVISVVLAASSVAGAYLSKESFMVNYESFILILLYVLVPWTAINLVDYYLLRHGQYDVQAFFRQDGGVYGRINGAAVGCYLLGILVQIPFIASPLYTGPLARAAGNIDLSWIVGLLVTGPAYYGLARISRAQTPPAAVQYAPGER
ncbi:MAG TPA: cytosine permease [Steroidobacteraceae bacterium]|jgi:NCS1 family nucleobase:cation symporter-1